MVAAAFRVVLRSPSSSAKELEPQLPNAAMGSNPTEKDLEVPTAAPSTTESTSDDVESTNNRKPEDKNGLQGPWTGDKSKKDMETIAQEAVDTLAEVMKPPPIKWNFRGGDGNTLPSPPNLATPTMGSGPSFLHGAGGGWERKCLDMEEGAGGV
jgi:hypothetical protein